MSKESPSINPSSLEYIQVIPEDHYVRKVQDIEVARRGIKMMGHQGIICSGIYVGDNDPEDISLMKEMFVDDFVICKNFNYVDTYLMDKISKQIIRSIKKANYN